MIWNAAVSGAAFWGPPLWVAGQIGDQLTAWPAKRLGAEVPPLTTAVEKAVSASVRSRSFEREADYLGLYMLARAGGSAAAVGPVFDLFATVSPLSSWLEVSHPTVPERAVLMELTADEIAAKEERGQPLVPDGWDLED